MSSSAGSGRRRHGLAAPTVSRSGVAERSVHASPRGRGDPRTGRKRFPSSRDANMRSMPYVELHCHSAFSFLDGASDPAELAATAADFGYPALALTDHDGIWGSMEVERHSQGLICLSGCAREGAVADRWERGQLRQAEALGRRLLRAFGPDSFR